jgi:RNA polymerase sigma factor for flagellar operon FliA
MTTATANTPEQRQALILKHYPMARSIACRIYQRLPKAVDVDDLISAAVMGLIEAIDRYDVTRAVPFEPYAKHRIHGSVVDALRAADWVPRSVRRKADLLDTTRASQNRVHGRSPTRPEMATALNVSPEKYDGMVVDSEIRTLLSLDAPVGTDNPTPLIEQVAGSHNMMRRWQKEERKAATVNAIQGLPERERTAIALYYLHELSLKEVGAVLSVTESRACQLCSQGVKRLRTRLKSYAN